MTNTRERTKDDESGPLSAIDVEAQRWVAALTLTGLLMTLVAIAGLCAATTPHNVDQACFQKKMADEHALLEALFQTPMEQDVMVEAMHACSPTLEPLLPQHAIAAFPATQTSRSLR